MQSQVRWRNLEPTPSLTVRVVHKLRRLERMAGAEANAVVTLSGGVSHIPAAASEAELVLSGPDLSARGHATASTPLAALDAVLDLIERQLVKARQRPRRKRGRKAAAL